MKKMQAEKLAFLPLHAVRKHVSNDDKSPMTNSTAVSSQEGHFSDIESMEGDVASEINGFDSPISRKSSNHGAESAWKKKVKTELCKFWLNGQECENSQKEQGCGFAHGQDELQKKKGLSRQYLTSVCKNFVEHPSKCTYGQRCIFQHPTFDVRQRQKYTDMIKDNARYTAMRLF